MALQQCSLRKSFIHYPVPGIQALDLCQDSSEILEPSEILNSTNAMKTDWVNHTIGRQKSISVRGSYNFFFFFNECCYSQISSQIFFQITIPPHVPVKYLKTEKTLLLLCVLGFSRYLPDSYFPFRDFYLQPQLSLGQALWFVHKTIGMQGNKSDSTHAFYFK